MKNVYLTGSTGGIGRALFALLETSGYNVIRVTSRLEDTEALTKEVTDLLKAHPADVLINCAGFGVFRPHEEIPVETITKLIAVNLTAPMILSKLCLRPLKARRGAIVNITSVEATRHARNSALYTAAKAGLRHFSLALFEEVRRAGVRVTSVNPGITRSGFFTDLDFEPREDADYALEPEEVARQVLAVLESEAAVTDVTILPQKEGVERKKRP